MKTSTSTYNPLSEILSYFPETTESALTLPQIETIKNLLDLGGVHCESMDEVVSCIELLAELDALDVEKIKKHNNTYYKVTRKNYG